MLIKITLLCPAPSLKPKVLTQQRHKPGKGKGRWGDLWKRAQGWESGYLSSGPSSALSHCRASGASLPISEPAGDRLSRCWPVSVALQPLVAMIDQGVLTQGMVSALLPMNQDHRRSQAYLGLTEVDKSLLNEHLCKNLSTASDVGSSGTFSCPNI